jgi:exopolyphosphatase/guanosine-5'-triphosphate,3'-diphosphate pyrophosphatase
MENKYSIILRLAQKYQYEKAHAEAVSRNSGYLYDFLQKNKIISIKNNRNLLEKAALLHDIGAFISRKKHNEHSQHIIEHDELLSDYPALERKILGIIAFNHKKKLSKDTNRLYRDDVETVLVFSSLIRVADALDYTRENLQISDIYIKNNTIYIKTISEMTEIIKERLIKKKELFVNLTKHDICLEMGR